MQSILMKLFLALGGGALIFSLLTKNAKEAVHKAAGFLILKVPGAKAFIASNAERIKSILEEAEKGLEEAVDDTKVAEAGPAGTAGSADKPS